MPGELGKLGKCRKDRGCVISGICVRLFQFQVSREVSRYETHLGMHLNIPFQVPFDISQEISQSNQKFASGSLCGAAFVFRVLLY
jgi:hypothetical protein